MRYIYLCLLRYLKMICLLLKTFNLNLRRPYAKMIDQALKHVHLELKKSNIYLLRNNMKLIKYSSDKDFTEFIFSSITFEVRKKYLSSELRNRTEEIMSEYLDKYEM